MRARLSPAACVLCSLLAAGVAAARPLPAVPVAETVGLLSLPTPAERRPDGGAWLVVEHGPKTLKGKRFWLRWAPRGREAEWDRRTRVDVRAEDAVMSSVQAGNRFIEPVFGWDEVSALESLAASRQGAPIRVGLDDAVREGADVLRTSDGPIEVSGTHRLLAQVVSSEHCRRGRITLKPYDKGRGAFSRPAISLAYAPVDPATPGEQGPATSLCGIETSPSNPHGFVWFGSFDGAGQFVIAAVLPRALFAPAGAPPVVQDASYFRTQNFADIRAAHTGVRTTVVHDGPWVAGTRGVVLHVYGNTGGPRGDPALWRRLSAGHFSLGFFEVRRDPLTDRPAAFVVYTQLYGGNPDGILSARVARHAYLGDLARGVMFRRAVSDVLVALPDPGEVVVGRVRQDPLALWRYELDVMAARYRSGDGVGGVIIGPANSCVQDATQATYITAQRWRAEVVQHEDVIAARRRGDGGRALVEVAAWNRRFSALEKHVVGWGRLRRDWRAGAKLYAQEPSSNEPAVIDAPRAALSVMTMTPRSGHDRFAEHFVEAGEGPVRVQRMNFEGGRIDGIAPLAPKSILRR